MVRQLYSGIDIWKEFGAEIQNIVGFKAPRNAEQVAINIGPPGGMVLVNFYNELKWQSIRAVSAFTMEYSEQFDRLLSIFSIPHRTIQIKIKIPFWEAVPEIAVTYYPTFDLEEVADDN